MERLERFVSARAMVDPGTHSDSRRPTGCAALVFTNAIDSSWHPPAPVSMTAEMIYGDHAEGTDYQAIVRHADPDARRRHEELGFFDGWGSVTAALASLPEGRSAHWPFPKVHTVRMTSAIPEGVVDACRSAQSIAVLSGAGMSAESGIPTFRDAQTGLWEQYEPARIATPEAWQRDPSLVWAWYQWRAALVRDSEPNAGHVAIARWQASSDVTVVTQNVDDLHERGGASVAAHVHGSLFAPRCSACERPLDGESNLPREPVSSIPPPRCGTCGGAVRPGVVWFGEGLRAAPGRLRSGQ